MRGVKELERELNGKVLSQGLGRKVSQGKRRQRAGDVPKIASSLGRGTHLEP